MNKTNSEVTLGPPMEKKIPSVAAGFSLTKLLNCADVEMALSPTGEKEAQDIPQLLQQLLSQGHSCRLYQAQSLCPALGDPRQRQRNLPAAEISTSTTARSNTT